MKDKFITTVACPYCGEEHKIGLDDSLRRGANVMTCLQKVGYSFSSDMGCGKRFIVDCTLVAYSVEKVGGE